jgi:hypothetical protein
VSGDDFVMVPIKRLEELEARVAALEEERAAYAVHEDPVSAMFARYRERIRTEVQARAAGLDTGGRR